MTDAKFNRRDFLSALPYRIMQWSPALGLLGMRYHPYAAGGAGGYAGWVTFCGRLVGYVPL